MLLLLLLFACLFVVLLLLLWVVVVVFVFIVVLGGEVLGLGGGYFYCLTSVCISVCFGCVSLLRVLQPLTLSYNSYRTATSGCQREGMCRRYDRKDYWYKIYI